MKIFIVPNLRKPQAKEIATQAAEILRQQGAQVLFREEDGVQLEISSQEIRSHQQAIEESDAIVTIGGDGTLLRIAREIQPARKPLLGINLGRLGFLATCEPCEMQEKLSLLAKGEFISDSRTLLEAKITNQGQIVDTLTALNDIVLFKGIRTQTIGLQVFCDGISLSRYRGDGVVIATPTGSTAYSLSAGGAVVDAALQGILFTPICAHGVQNPPMVFSANRRLRICMESQSEEPIYVSADGNHPAMEIQPQSEVEVFCSSNTVILVQFSPTDQFEAIDKKLIRKTML